MRIQRWVSLALVVGGVTLLLLSAAMTGWNEYETQRMWARQAEYGSLEEKLAAERAQEAAADELYFASLRAGDRGARAKATAAVQEAMLRERGLEQALGSHSSNREMEDIAALEGHHAMNDRWIACALLLLVVGTGLRLGDEKSRPERVWQDA